MNPNSNPFDRRARNGGNRPIGTSNSALAILLLLLVAYGAYSIWTFVGQEGGSRKISKLLAPIADLRRGSKSAPRTSVVKTGNAGNPADEIPPARREEKRVDASAVGIRFSFSAAKNTAPVSDIYDEGLRRKLREAFAAKLKSPRYLERKNTPGIPNSYQDFPEEKAIKKIRSEITASLRTPSGVVPIEIPLVETRPDIDGFVDPKEWAKAISIELEKRESPTRMLLMSDGRLLFLACLAPGETTENGYDQFRFYYHLSIVPELVNERIHVDGSGGTRSLRATRIKWQGPPPSSENERWKKYDISDWNIYRLHDGASSIHGYRHYEALIDLKEAGIHRGVPFPARVEVESDPARSPTGKFLGRKLIGKLGSDRRPAWFIVPSSSPPPER